ncbi:MAG: HEAT repeat domain-containing protein [Candidatus Solibacter sp.]
MLGKFCLTFALIPASLSLAQGVYALSGSASSQTTKLEKLAAGTSYTFLFSVDSPAALTADSRIAVSVNEAGRVLIAKTLHAGDADLYASFRPSGPAELRVEAKGAPAAKYHLQINRAPLAAGANHRWQDALPLTLGQLVTASSDELEYLPLPGTSRRDLVSAAAGDHWYRFNFDSATPKLVFFQLELMDRDDLPADVSVFREAAGKLEEYTEGQDPVAQPHEVQALPGNKFAPRVLRQTGAYYVRVRANHPEFKLRTRVYDPAPYANPREAVRTAVDYIMGAGDSWFANTPRRGGAFDRVAGVHQETSLCVACHASHFSQRAQLYAIANGYPVAQREQLQFLEERFYNNPRPFYGFEKQGAVWSRVISAPANVLSRISVLTSLYEDNVSGTPRPAWRKNIVEYLNLYYAGRDKLPPDETNGNTPLVSAHEVAWYSWKTTHDARLPGMIAEGEVKNMVDLCYQTLALAEIDSAKYAAQIKANAERILSLQRPSGQWSMRFEPKEPEVEFQTGHALWALAAAGIAADQPQVQKGVQYLLARQQPFGGWMDPAQSFENFKTPFRETQFAVLALSTFYPNSKRPKGWDAPAPTTLSSDPARLLTELDALWEVPSTGVLRQVEAATQSNETLVRQAAAEALGRLAMAPSAPLLVKLLEDPSKLVQRTAAWGLRQIYAAHPETSHRELLAALSASNDRLRWGATRVFAHHFAALAPHQDLVLALDRLAADPVPAVRLQAVRSLWQAWFWNADPKVRGQIEDTLLAGMAQSQHPWVETNLRAAVYNLADENIRYLYNNWVALLARPEDRDRAIQGRLSVESQLADKFTAVLERGPDAQKKQLLGALAELPLRRGDIYDLDAPPANPKKAPVYSRLGNDIEQIAFFGSSAAGLSRALMPLLDSPDEEMRTLARHASLIVRETAFPLVERAAGGRNEATLELAHKLDGDPAAADVARAFHIPPPRNAPVRPNAPARPAPATPLDEDFFHDNIDPIFQKKGADGYACVNCHNTHTLFNATWSTVKNVIDRSDPENSLLLRKPISTAEAEGIANSAATAHGGGQRWPKGSPEYETILKWIAGKQ